MKRALFQLSTAARGNLARNSKFSKPDAGTNLSRICLGRRRLNMQRSFSSGQPPRQDDDNTIANVVQFTQTSRSSSVYDPDTTDATQLVDNLLSYTRQLMDSSNSEDSSSSSSSSNPRSCPRRHHLVAFSGGIDSSVVAALVHQSSRGGEESTLAVLGLSPAVPADQIALAEDVARIIGIDLEQIETTEGTDETYIANEGQACLACKTHLYTCLESILKHATTTTTSYHQQNLLLYNGTNADDLKDPTRLGLIAAERFQVQSPLQYTTKEQVRLAGKHLGLPHWNYAASPCLRSRLALGVQAIPEHLQRIEQAERFVRQSLQLNATYNLRVRLLTGNRAMVEVEPEILPIAEEHLSSFQWQSYFQGELGFASIHVRCFKSGSVATPSKVTTADDSEEEAVVHVAVGGV